MDTHLLVSCGKDSSRKICWNLDGEKVPTWEGLFGNRNQGLFLSVYVDDTKTAGTKQNVAPMWKTCMKHVDLDEPTSFLDHLYLGCTRRECKPNEIIIEYRVCTTNFCCSNRKITRVGENLTQRRLRGPTTWKDMLKNALRDVAKWRTNKAEQSCKVSSPCLDDRQFKEEQLESVGELSKVCSQIVLKCLYLARIGRPDILWSVNKRARSITKWTGACDRR